jgi:oxygen-dependent protoporphyrinogen oxidase
MNTQDLNSGSAPVLVIGAGLSGLACAFHLHQRGIPVQLLDAGDSPGGNLRTRIVPAEDGRWVLDLGPNSFGDGSEDLMDLVRACGAQHALVPAGEAAGKARFLFRQGRILPVPAGPGLMFSPILPWRQRLRLMREPFVPPSNPEQAEESLAEFCDRRLGRMARLKLLTPVVSGIYAGDPEQLGAESSFPAMVDLEREHGSLVRAAIKGNGPPKRGRLQTFDDGLQSLAAHVTDRLGESYQPGTMVQGLARHGEGWQVELSNGELRTASAVVLAIPAQAAADLLEGLHPELAGELNAVPYAPMAVVHIGVRREDAGKLPDAFGFLVPRDEGLRILGAIFSSRLFEGRAPAGHELVTVFTGGALDPESIELQDDEILAYVRDDLRTALGGSWQPVVSEVTRWPVAIPQYVVGHKDRLERIEELQRDLEGIELLGNWRGGIAMPNCAREGKDVAERLAKRKEELSATA